MTKARHVHRWADAPSIWRKRPASKPQAPANRVERGVLKRRQRRSRVR
jgi:hypothetical protein